MEQTLLENYGLSGKRQSDSLRREVSGKDVTLANAEKRVYNLLRSLYQPPIRTMSRFALLFSICFAFLFIAHLQAADTPSYTELIGHESFVRSVAFSPDGKKIVTTSLDKTARIWDAESGKELKKIQYYDSESRIVADSADFSPDGKQIVTASGHNIAKIWDAESGEELQKIESNTFKNITSAAFSPDGKKIVTSAGEVTQLWDAESGEELQKWGNTSGEVGAANFSPCGKKIVRMGYWDGGVVIIYDTESGKALKTFEAGFGFDKAAFSPDGKKIIITETFEGDRGFFVQIWDAESGEVLVKMGRQRYWIRHVAFSPDGKKVVAVGNDMFARIWDAESGKLLYALRNRESGHSAAFSPDGKRVATNGNVSRARIWTLE